MSERKASIVRTTDRAEVRIALTLDGCGLGTVQTDLPFLNQMLTLFARHGGFDLDLQCRAGEGGSHNLMEEVGACLGLAVDKALGDKEEIFRTGFCCAPVEEHLARAVIEISGHSCLVYRVHMPMPLQGGMEALGLEEFWSAFASHARLNLHIELLYGSGGSPSHEAVFKAVARALRDACSTQHRHQVPPNRAARASKTKRDLR
jgi:imidazoleglycerol-phosphate dehydratase